MDKSFVQAEDTLALSPQAAVFFDGQEVASAGRIRFHGAHGKYRLVWCYNNAFFQSFQKYGEWQQCHSHALPDVLQKVSDGFTMNPSHAGSTCRRARIASRCSQTSQHHAVQNSFDASCFLCSRTERNKRTKPFEGKSAWLKSRLKHQFKISIFLVFFVEVEYRYLCLDWDCGGVQGASRYDKIHGTCRTNKPRLWASITRPGRFLIYQCQFYGIACRPQARAYGI